MRRLRWKITGHVLALLATVLLGGLLSATLVRLAPGFDTDERELDPHLNAQSVQALREARRQDHNVFRFYFSYMKRAANGDLGTSLALGQPVRTLLRDRAPLTLRLLTIGPCAVLAADLDLGAECGVAAAFHLRHADHRGERNLALSSRRSAGVAFGAVECARVLGHCADRVPPHLPLHAKSPGEGLFPASHHHRESKRIG